MLPVLINSIIYNQSKLIINKQLVTLNLATCWDQISRNIQHFYNSHNLSHVACGKVKIFYSFHWHVQKNSSKKNKIGHLKMKKIQI